MNYQTFIFQDYQFNPQDGILRLNYAIDDRFRFTETFKFPLEHMQVDWQDNTWQQLWSRLGFYLHIVCGISYYKAFLPEKLLVESGKLDQEEADFFAAIYLNGLGEFSYNNQVDLGQKIHFDVTDSASHRPFHHALPNKYLVAVGGGKDSLVSLKLLQQLVPNQELSLFYCGNGAAPIVRTIQQSGLPALAVERQIDPLLIQLNRNPNQQLYNGHVPITAINSLIAAATGLLQGYGRIVFSNERSANVGNVEYCGRSINHQWSKTFGCETLLHNLLQQKLTPDLQYFSLLRPLAEWQIVQLFCHYCPEYYKVFSSCNRNFKITDQRQEVFWCGECDKCRFIFLMLACFMPKTTLLEIFGRNLLAEMQQLEGYSELVGLQGHKPFECVGEIEEAILAIFLLHQRDEWHEEIVVQILVDRLRTLSQINSAWLRQQALKYLSPQWDNNYIPLELQEPLKKLVEMMAPQDIIKEFNA